MTEELFTKIFHNEIVPFIRQIESNNSYITVKDLDECSRKVYSKYIDLRGKYRKVIFGKDSEQLLDRHKVASCICGAFLYVSVFNKGRLVEHIKETRESMEAYFYYVNEFVAFYAGCKFLSFYMMYDCGEEEKRKICQEFPIIPQATKNKGQGGLSSILFHLAQVKDEEQIGIEHYDKYSYSMFYFMLEKYFFEIGDK